MTPEQRYRLEELVKEWRTLVVPHGSMHPLWEEIGRAELYLSTGETSGKTEAALIKQWKLNAISKAPVEEIPEGIPTREIPPPEPSIARPISFRTLENSWDEQLVLEIAMKDYGVSPKNLRYDTLLRAFVSDDIPEFMLPVDVYEGIRTAMEGSE